MYDIPSKKPPNIKTKKKVRLFYVPRLDLGKDKCFLRQGNSKIHDLGELQRTVFSFAEAKAKLHILLASLTFLFWIACKIASIYYSQ